MQHPTMLPAHRSRPGGVFALLIMLADLLALSSADLQEAAGEVYDSEFSDTAFHPVVDGTLIPDLPMKRLAAADGPTTPVIIGANLDEARYWLYYISEIDRLPLRYARPWLTALVGERADQVIDAYRRERPTSTRRRPAWPWSATSGSGCRRSAWPRRWPGGACRCACTWPR
jgi:carboxylesterase type B